MIKGNLKLGIYWLVIMLVLGAFSFLGTTSAEEVVYAMDIKDPDGDSVGTLTTDEGVAADSDILMVTSAKDGDNIVLTMKVRGTVYINGTDYVTGYQFNIDINGDNTYDWLVTVTSYGNFHGTNAQLQDDEFYLVYLDNATGAGTDTVTVKFLLTQITDSETIDSWNIYGSSSVVKADTMISYVDMAPDDGFTTSGNGGNGGNGDDGDNDDDGMPDDWETMYGLDPNDPSDALDDKDGDGYMNIEEYGWGTDPTDPNSTPDDGSGNGGGNGGGGDGGVNPSTETPTDTTIEVEITEAKFSVNEEGESYEVDVLIKGTTSGADHCLIMLINTYENGATDSEYDWEEPFDMAENPTTKQFLEDMGYTDFHFKDTSDGNWKTWEYRIKGTIDASDYEDPDEDANASEPSKVNVYVRAFSDASESKWNQDSKEVSVKVDDSKDKDDDGGGFLPGFGSALVLISFATALVIASATLRKKR
jgi:hypothetical protein